MKWWLIAVVLSIAINGYSQDGSISQHAADQDSSAIEYVGAAKSALVRYLEERVPNLDKNPAVGDTVYVGYPRENDPPPELLQCSPHNRLILRPYSHYIASGQGFTLAIEKRISADSIKLFVAEIGPPGSAPPLTHMRSQMGPRFGLVTLKREHGQWEVTHWQWDTVDY